MNRADIVGELRELAARNDTGDPKRDAELLRKGIREIAEAVREPGVNYRLIRVAVARHGDGAWQAHGASWMTDEDSIDYAAADPDDPPGVRSGVGVAFLEGHVNLNPPTAGGVRRHGDDMTTTTTTPTTEDELTGISDQCQRLVHLADRYLWLDYVRKSDHLSLDRREIGVPGGTAMALTVTAGSARQQPLALTLEEADKLQELLGRALDREQRKVAEEITAARRELALPPEGA